MAKIFFSEEEIRAALPKAREGSTLARRWEMFSDPEGGQYAQGEEAAHFVHDFLVKLLTADADIGLVIDFTDDIDMAVDDLASKFGSIVAGGMRQKFGETFGFTDTEPRYHMSVFFRKLFGLRA